MNTPIRYDWYEEDMRPAPHGLWIEWNDYLAIMLENELLKNQIAYLDKKLDEELDKGVQS